MSFDVDITVDYGQTKVEASFETGPGITALFGESGAGKSTVVHTISGLLRPVTGRIAINGQVLFDAPSSLDVPTRKRRIGLVFQDARLFPHFNVRGNLTYARKFGGRVRSGNFDAIVDMLGLRDLLDRRPGTLSGGERQRVAIGRALLSDPRALAMDEPMASLDIGRKSEIMPYLDRLRRETKLPILYVSHAIDEIARLADTVVVMKGGRVEAVAPAADILLRPEYTGFAGPGALLTGRVISHDGTYDLTRIDVDGQQLIVPQVGLAPNTAIRIRVPARDVTLSLVRPQAISIRNIVAGTVTSLSASAGPELTVSVMLNTQIIAARVTRLAAEDLALKEGQPIFALLKTVAVEPGDVAPRRSNV